jgi:8-oxo-dGTP pyrophosphatase MutT (NUDIX family)
MPHNRRFAKRPVLSAGIIPIFFSPVGPLTLLLRVYNYWDFPKGIVERGENPFAAAQREFYEETSIPRVEFPWGTDYIETAPYSFGKIARYYIGLVRSQNVVLAPNPLTNVTEHHEFRWLKFERARHLLVPRVKSVLDWATARVEPAAPLLTV